MEQQTKHENFVAGVVGAVLGSFLGAVCIILVSQLGYVAVISGVVMGVCTLKGYELLGGTLSRKGIVVSLALVLGMTWLAFQMDCAIEVAREAEIDFFEAFRSIGYLLEEGYLNPRLLGQFDCPVSVHPAGGGAPDPGRSKVPGGRGRPACVPAAASLYKGYLSCVPSILLSVAVLPEKVSCPIPAACSGVGTLPILRDILSRSMGTVILFSRCCPSMNYPKSTPK